MAASVKSFIDLNAAMVQRQRTMIDVEVNGLTALLMHKGTTVTKTKSVTREQARQQYGEEWKKTAYLDGDGYLYS